MMQEIKTEDANFPYEDFAALDFTYGYPARDTFWNWVSLAGISVCGKRVGLNVVDPILDEINNENAFWIDGTLHKIGKVRFEYDSQNTLSPWKIYSEDGSVDLTFKPIGKRQQSIERFQVDNLSFKFLSSTIYSSLSSLDMMRKRRRQNTPHKHTTM